MAKGNQGSSQTIQNHKPQGKEDSKGRKSGFLFGLLAFLAAAAIIVVVLGGLFFIIVRNNVNNLAESYRKQIESIPVIKLALPRIPDLEDPEYLTDEELRLKYQELRKVRDDLKKQLKAAGEQIYELQKTNDELSKTIAENEKAKKDILELQAWLEQQKKQFMEDKQKIDGLIAKGDKERFKEFFEKIDKETAQRLFSEILKEEKADGDTRKFVQIYENMAPASAARIFEQLGDSKIDLIAGTLKNMKKENSAEILAAMEPSFASKVTEKLSESYKNKPVGQEQ